MRIACDNKYGPNAEPGWEIAVGVEEEELGLEYLVDLLKPSSPN